VIASLNAAVIPEADGVVPGATHPLAHGVAEVVEEPVEVFIGVVPRIAQEEYVGWRLRHRTILSGIQKKLSFWSLRGQAGERPEGAI
jgi:hypothetical protein